MNYGLIIFDFDGVLADTFPWLLNTINAVADKYRFRRFDLRDMKELRSLDMKQIIARQEIPFWKFPFIVRHMRSLMKRDIAGISLFPGIEDALRALAESGAVLAIVTSNSRENVVKVLGPHLVHLFCYLECSSLFGKKAKIRHLLEKSQINVETAIYIGDELRDAQAARESGVGFGAVAWGYNDIDALALFGAQEIFMFPEELVRLTAA